MKSLVPLLMSTLLHLCQGKGIKFDGSSDYSDDDNSNLDTDTRFLFGSLPALPSITSGNEFVDGALVGAAAGVLGGAVGKPIIDGLLGGGCNPNCCGRRKRQTQFDESGDTKFFLPTGNSQCCNGRRRRNAQEEEDPNQKFFLGGGGTNCYNPNPCGRKKRQSEEEEDGTNTKFLAGLFGNNNANCQGFNNPGFNQNNQGFNPGFGNTNNNVGFNTGSTNTRQCRCSQLSKTDNNGREEAKCARPDRESRRKWCYITSDSSCSDSKPSRKYPNNPWSYQACQTSTRSGK